MALPSKNEAFGAAQYLEWEATQEERHEYIAGEVFAMTGARDAHNTIALNVATSLRAALRGTPCRAFIADMKLRVETADAYFYPDVFVTCDNRDKAPEADLAKRHPCLVIEVLSDSTAAYDRGLKFEYYQALESLREYLLLEQDRRHADLFRKNGEGLWVLHPTSGYGTVSLDSIGAVLDMDAIYEDVSFASVPAPAQGPTASRTDSEGM
ncbi:MAG: Uma2 family endonuclease [Rhodocyclaceae bacterium]|nr:Uma2 family endonuclease [Rhodocyclaceae bacterium]